MTTAQVEHDLRRHVEQVGGVVGFTFRHLAADAEFWPGDEATALAMVEALDQPRRCEAIAVEAAERFGLGVAFGWIAVQVDDQVMNVAHYWNLDGRGRVVDAALRRRRPDGYLGKPLSERELATISRFSFLSAVA